MTDPTPLPEPRRIEWRGPSGWTVWMDEDGVHLRPSSTSLEMGEVATLFTLWDRACAAYRDNEPVPAPQYPNLPF